jgi:hypothetical protein
MLVGDAEREVRFWGAAMGGSMTVVFLLLGFLLLGIDELLGLVDEAIVEEDVVVNACGLSLHGAVEIERTCVVAGSPVLSLGRWAKELQRCRGKSREELAVFARRLELRRTIFFGAVDFHEVTGQAFVASEL